MSITLDALETFIRESGLTYRRDDGFLTVPFTTTVYRSPKGDAECTVIVGLYEQGEHLTVSVPYALVAQGPHVDRLLRACLSVQWLSLTVKFEYEEVTGEVRATVDFPLADAVPTARQLERCIRGIVQALEVFYPTLQRALTEGVIGFPPSYAARQEAVRMVAEELTSTTDPVAREAAEVIAAADTAGSDALTAKRRPEAG